jgi:ribonuclease HI
MKHVTIYTDGACLGNPGPGGYGVILSYNGKEKEISKGFKNTTNNRMELRAVIEGLKALKENCDVTIVTDSKYVAEAMQKGWVAKWKANGWKRNKKEKALNIDLWEQLLELCEKHNVKFEWISGHSGHPQNERCDKMAVNAAKQKDLLEEEKR